MLYKIMKIMHIFDDDEKKKYDFPTCISRWVGFGDRAGSGSASKWKVGSGFGLAGNDTDQQH
jgi:hypothetical protein